MILDPRLHSVDIVTLRAPVALRLRDASDLSLVSDDLLVSATEMLSGHQSIPLQVTPSGTWTATRLPAISPADMADPALWPSVAKPIEIQVRDPSNRYLPMRMIADLPAEAAIGWPGFASLPDTISSSVLPVGRPTGYVPDYVPLFPGSAHISLGGRAEVRAHLAIANAGQPAGNASFSVMTVSVDGLVRGVGVADGDGVILVSFPYPLLPAPTAAERAAGTTRFEWTVSVAVYCGQLSLPADGAPPLLNEILAQLNRSPSLLLERLGTPTALPEQTLRIGQPLVLRSARASPAKPSSLFLIPA